MAGAVILAAVVLTGLVVLGSAAPAASSASPGTAGPAPAAPPAGHAYLGALVDPSGAGEVPSPGQPLRRALREQLDGVASLNKTLDRPLAIMSVHQDWDKPLYNSGIDQILAAGAVPMIGWDCGDTDAHVAAGVDDATVIRPFAEQLATLGAPVLLRWFYDPNLTTAAGASRCLGTAGAAGYVSAFAHIRQVFRSVGATNVGFVWSLDTAAGDSDWNSWFPGASNVDWIAGDDFACSANLPAAGGFSSGLYRWYRTFAGSGKPLMISDAEASGATAPKVKDLTDALATRLPLIGALVYHDAPRPPACGGSAGSADPAATVLAELSREPVFQPPRAAAVVAVTAPATTVAVGQTVKLAASVTVTGGAGAVVTGSVSFTLGGAPLAGCAAVPVRSGAACSTSSLPPGTDQISVGYSGDALTAGSVSPSVGVTVSPSARWSGPPAIPGPGHAYLGAWVQPPAGQAEPVGASRMDLEIQALPGFDASLGRPLSVVHVFQSWNQPEPNAVLRRVMASGAMPLVDWKCGDSDANVAAGMDDPLISGYARQLAALGSPVFLRWFWEPNFDTSSSVSAVRCLDPPGHALGAAGYVAAFRHIHDLFVAAGATNVAFVWSVGSEGNDQDLVDYYPGSGYVDWIAVDGYRRSDGAGSETLTQMLRRWYTSFSSFGLPMMISETGAVPAAQPSFLASLSDQLPTAFPQVKAVAYLDSDPSNGTHSYTLSPDTGTAAFAALSRTGYFQPPRQPTVITVSVSPNPVRAGTRLALVAAWPAGDGGGEVTFTVDGQTVPGCGDSYPASTVTCHASGLPPGTHHIAAMFSGDALFGPSQSALVALTVTPEPPLPSRSAPGSSPSGLPAPPAPPVPVAPVQPIIASGVTPVFTGQPTIAALAALPPVPSSAAAASGGPLESAGGWIRPEPPGSAPTGSGPEPPSPAGSTGPASPLDPALAGTVQPGQSDRQPAALRESSGSSPLFVYLAVPVLCAEGYLVFSWLREERLHRRNWQPPVRGID